MKTKLTQDFVNKRYFRSHNMASKYQMTGSCKDATSSLYYTVSDELQRAWKEAVVTN